MTLILVTANETGDIEVVADTLFGHSGDIGLEFGPKTFLAPITISDMDETKRIALPPIGFAFAGNTLSGQFVHALASTCLQNLAAPNTDNEPDIREIAEFYARCAIRTMAERRRHKALDSYGFEGVVFGYSPSLSCATAYHFNAHVDAEGNCVAPIVEIDLEPGIPQAIGSGAASARRGIAFLRSRHIEINPFSLMSTLSMSRKSPRLAENFKQRRQAQRASSFTP